MKYLYSTCFASFVIEDSKIIDKIEFKDVLNKNKKLEKGLWIEQEEQLIKKHNPDAFIGFKIDDKIKLTPDLSLASDIEDKFRESNLKITQNKIKKSVTPDQLIIQCINTIEDLNQDTNRMVKRLREWYSLHDPETDENVSDHYAFVKTVINKVENKGLMGADLKEKDLNPIFDLANSTKSLFELRSRLTQYLEQSMNKVCPNITAVAGALIGAKLLQTAGSLKDMATMASSTIQLLGAEKALFRHLTTGALPPKYGYIHEHPLISKAKRSDHGRVARALADKISLASRVDYFKGDFIGDKYRTELEERFR
ncbi:MAG: putative NOP5 family protein [Candidatus Woesearchaeota archaeon]|nr:putative NOP5 family protein [Candidatus Woesearchaeota archaeon]